MRLILLAVVVFFLFGFRRGWIQSQWSGNDWLQFRTADGFKKGLLFGLLGLAVGVVIAAIAGYQQPREWHKAKVVTLVSLRNQEGLAGEFFLGSGQIDTQSYYFFFKKLGDGFQLDKQPATESVTVFEEDRKDGELSVYQKESRRFGSAKWYQVQFVECCRYEFHIPRGTIQREFKVR